MGTVKYLFQTAQQLNYVGTFSTLSRDAGEGLGDERYSQGRIKVGANMAATPGSLIPTYYEQLSDFFH